MEAKKELEALKAEFMSLSLNDKEAISAFKKKINKVLSEKSDKEKKDFAKAYEEDIKEAIERADKVYNFVNIKSKLSDVINIVSMSYIAETYFKKSRSWLSQRLNGHSVNGLPVSFTEKEIKILSNALDDISLKFKNAARSII